MRTMALKELTPLLPTVFGPKSPYKALRDESWVGEWPSEKKRPKPTPEDHARCREARRWDYEVKCRHGVLYPHSEARVGYAGMGSVRLAQLLEIPGTVLGQRGDVEFSLHFPESALAQVAQIVVPRMRRVISPEQKAVMASRLAENLAKNPTNESF